MADDALDLEVTSVTEIPAAAAVKPTLDPIEFAINNNHDDYLVEMASCILSTFKDIYSKKFTTRVCVVENSKGTYKFVPIDLMVDRLMSIADHFSSKTNKIDDALTLYLYSARYYISTKHEERAWEKFFGLVETVPNPLKFYSKSLSYSSSSSPAPEKAVAGILQHITDLPETSDRQQALVKAEIYTASGSVIEKQVVTAFVKEVEALPTPAEQMAAYKKAIRYAQFVDCSDSAIAQESEEKLHKLQQAGPLLMQLAGRFERAVRHMPLPRL